MLTDRKQKAVVAMSGGVDSSTVAAILKSQGYDVVGITLQLYDHGMTIGKKGACCAGQDIYDAQMAAEKIGIKHYVLNYESVFKQQVIDDFADSYLKGETPIPCVRCNQKVKFLDLFTFAKNLNADFLATGHYVQRIEKNGVAEMHIGNDPKKDQSYFLFTTTQEQLDFLRFPIGHLNKDKTREIAKDFGLEIANKPDSQDICFVPDGNYAKIVEKMRPEALKRGYMKNTDGEIIGMHNGIINFTIGQRRGLGVAAGKPMYVVKIIPETNTVVVGSEDALYNNTLIIKEINFLAADLGNKFNCQVKLRSTQSPTDAQVEVMQDGNAKITLTNPYKGITPGQACVMYDGTKVLGGGWISDVVCDFQES